MEGGASRSPLVTDKEKDNPMGKHMTDKKPLTITVTEAHLDKSIASWDDMSLDHHSICEMCVVAMAVQEVTGKKAWVTEQAIAKAPIDYFVHEWQGDETAKTLVRLYDITDYDAIRAMLPVTVTFTPIEG